MIIALIGLKAHETDEGQMTSIARLSFALALALAVFGNSGLRAMPAAPAGWNSGGQGFIMVQAMPKPGGGRCIAYAQEVCGAGTFKAQADCRKQAQAKCYAQGKK
jgi:hypothetical protein